MKTTPALFRAYLLAQRARRLGTTLLAGTFVWAQVTPSLAFIDNSATVSGTYSGTTTSYGPSTQSVPVTPAAANLVVSKSAAAPIDVNADGVISVGDTITYTVTLTNNGNVTLTNVLPSDQGTKFNGVAGTGSLSSWTPTVGSLPVTLAPTQSKTYTAVYTLTALDADRAASIAAGVSNTAGANAKLPDLSAYSNPPANYSTATQTIPANPKLTVSKVAVLTTDANSNGKADLGDVITYTYTVANVGNVAMTNVSVTDQHGTPATTVTLGLVAYGADPAGIKSETLGTDGPLAAFGTPSTDATANNGIWSTLQPGATITLKFVHTVTQAEVDHG